MTAPRRIALAVGLLAIAVMGAFPPWVTAPVAHPSATTSVGYHFFFAPPSVPTGTTVWSSKHQRFERDGQPLPDGWAKVLAPPYVIGPQPMVIDYGGVLMPGFVRIDYRRLAVQWVVVAALVGVVLLLPAGRGRSRRLPAPLPPSPWPKDPPMMVFAAWDDSTRKETRKPDADAAVATSR